MRLCLGTLLVVAILLLLGANYALTTTLVADNTAGDSNVKVSGIVSPLAYGYAYISDITIPEPALLALLGAALVGFSKLLRKKPRRS